MAKVNLDRMAQKKQESQSGEFWKPEEGDTLAYIMPPCRDDDEWEPTAGLNYVPLVVHYGVGSDNKMCVCLDTKRNPILMHPYFQNAAAERGVSIDEDAGCPVCQAIDSKEIPTEQVSRVKAKTQFMWNLVPLEFKGRKSKDYSALTPQPVVYIAGKQVYDGLMECFNDNGDITDMDAAILAKITREGKDQQTKYKVQCDVKTIKKPMAIDDELRSLIATAMAPGEGCDLFKVAANLTKAREDVVALLAGSKVETDDDVAAEPAPSPAPRPTPKPVTPVKPAAKPVAAASKPVAAAAKPVPVSTAKPLAPSASAKPVAKAAVVMAKPKPAPVEEEAAEEEAAEEEPSEPVETDGLDDLEAELQASIAKKKGK